MHLLLAAVLASSAPPANLIFNGLDGRSTIASVRFRFPDAESKSICAAGQTILRSADGVGRCEVLSFEGYRLAGYEFEVSFFFAEAGTLKSVVLHWPDVGPGGISQSAAEIENAYWALVDLYVAKYGRYVSKPPCSYLGGRCQEWQMDGTSEWHAGGERISIEYDTKSKYMGGVSIKYAFAEKASFHRF